MSQQSNSPTPTPGRLEKYHARKLAGSTPVSTPNRSGIRLVDAMVESPENIAALTQNELQVKVKEYQRALESIGTKHRELILERDREISQLKEDLQQTVGDLTQKQELQRKQELSDFTEKYNGLKKKCRSELEKMKAKYEAEKKLLNTKIKDIWNETEKREKAREESISKERMEFEREIMKKADALIEEYKKSAKDVADRAAQEVTNSYGREMEAVASVESSRMDFEQKLRKEADAMIAKYKKQAADSQTELRKQQDAHRKEVEDLKQQIEAEKQSAEQSADDRIEEAVSAVKQEARQVVEQLYQERRKWAEKEKSIREEAEAHAHEIISAKLTTDGAEESQKRTKLQEAIEKYKGLANAARAELEAERKKFDGERLRLEEELIKTQNEFAEQSAQQDRSAKDTWQATIANLKNEISRLRTEHAKEVDEAHRAHEDDKLTFEKEVMQRCDASIRKYQQMMQESSAASDAAMHAQTEKHEKREQELAKQHRALVDELNKEIEQLKSKVRESRDEIRRMESASRRKLDELEAKHAADSSGKVGELKQERENAVKQAHEAAETRLSSAKAHYEEIVAGLQAQIEDLTEQLSSAERRALDSARNAFSHQMEKWNKEKASLAAEWLQERKQLLDEAGKAADSSVSVLKEQVVELQQTIAELKSQHSKELAEREDAERSVRDRHAQAMEEAAAKAKAVENELRKQHEEALASLKRSAKDDLEAAKKQHVALLSDKETAWQARHAKLLQQFEDERAEWTDRLEATQRENRENEHSLRADLAAERERFRSEAQEQSSAETSAVKQEMDALVERLREERVRYDSEIVSVRREYEKNRAAQESQLLGKMDSITAEYKKLLSESADRSAADKSRIFELEEELQRVKADAADELSKVTAEHGEKVKLLQSKLNEQMHLVAEYQGKIASMQSAHEDVKDTLTQQHKKALEQALTTQRAELVRKQDELREQLRTSQDECNSLRQKLVAAGEDVSAKEIDFVKEKSEAVAAAESALRAELKRELQQAREEADKRVQKTQENLQAQNQELQAKHAEEVLQLQNAFDNKLEGTHRNHAAALARVSSEAQKHAQERDEQYQKKLQAIAKEYEAKAKELREENSREVDRILKKSEADLSGALSRHRAELQSAQDTIVSLKDDIAKADDRAYAKYQAKLVKLEKEFEDRLARAAGEAKRVPLLQHFQATQKLDEFMLQAIVEQSGLRQNSEKHFMDMRHAVQSSMLRIGAYVRSVLAQTKNVSLQKQAIETALEDEKLKAKSEQKRQVGILKQAFQSQKDQIVANYESEMKKLRASMQQAADEAKSALVKQAQEHDVALSQLRIQCQQEVRQEREKLLAEQRVERSGEVRRLQASMLERSRNMDKAFSEAIQFHAAETRNVGESLQKYIDEALSASKQTISAANTSRSEERLSILAQMRTWLHTRMSHTESEIRSQIRVLERRMNSREQELEKQMEARVQATIQQNEKYVQELRDSMSSERDERRALLHSERARQKDAHEQDLQKLQAEYEDKLNLANGRVAELLRELETKQLDKSVGALKDSVKRLEDVERTLMASLESKKRGMLSEVAESQQRLEEQMRKFESEKVTYKLGLDQQFQERLQEERRKDEEVMETLRSQLVQEREEHNARVTERLRESEADRLDFQRECRRKADDIVAKERKKFEEQIAALAAEHRQEADRLQAKADKRVLEAHESASKYEADARAKIADKLARDAERWEDALSSLKAQHEREYAELQARLETAQKDALEKAKQYTALEESMAAKYEESVRSIREEVDAFMNEHAGQAATSIEAKLKKLQVDLVKAFASSHTVEDELRGRYERLVKENTEMIQRAMTEQAAAFSEEWAKLQGEQVANHKQLREEGLKMEAVVVKKQKVLLENELKELDERAAVHRAEIEEKLSAWTEERLAKHQSELRNREEVEKASRERYIQQRKELEQSLVDRWKSLEEQSVDHQREIDSQWVSKSKSLVNDIMERELSLQKTIDDARSSAEQQVIDVIAEKSKAISKRFDAQAVRLSSQVRQFLLEAVAQNEGRAQDVDKSMREQAEHMRRFMTSLRDACSSQSNQLAGMVRELHGEMSAGLRTHSKKQFESLKAIADQLSHHIQRTLTEKTKLDADAWSAFEADVVDRERILTEQRAELETELRKRMDRLLAEARRKDRETLDKTKEALFDERAKDQEATRLYERDLTEKQHEFEKLQRAELQKICHKLQEEERSSRNQWEDQWRQEIANVRQQAEQVESEHRQKLQDVEMKYGEQMEKEISEMMKRQRKLMEKQRVQMQTVEDARRQHDLERHRHADLARIEYEITTSERMQQWFHEERKTLDSENDARYRIIEQQRGHLDRWKKQVMLLVAKSVQESRHRLIEQFEEARSTWDQTQTKLLDDSRRARDGERAEFLNKLKAAESKHQARELALQAEKAKAVANATDSVRQSLKARQDELLEQHERERHSWNLKLAEAEKQHIADMEKQEERIKAQYDALMATKLEASKDDVDLKVRQEQLRLERDADQRVQEAVNKATKENDKRLKESVQRYESMLKEANATWQEKLDKCKASYDAEIAGLQSSLREVSTAAEVDREKLEESIRSQFSGQMSECEKGFTSTLDGIRAAHAEELRTLAGRHEEAMRTLRAEVDAEVKSVTDRCEERVNGLVATQKEEREKLLHDVGEERMKISRTQEEFEKEVLDRANGLIKGNTDKWEREFADLRGKHASELKDAEANRQRLEQKLLASRDEQLDQKQQLLTEEFESRLRELEDREARLHDGILAKEREQLLFQRQFIAQQEAKFESHLERAREEIASDLRDAEERLRIERQAKEEEVERRRELDRRTRKMMASVTMWRLDYQRETKAKYDRLIANYEEREERKISDLREQVQQEMESRQYTELLQKEEEVRRKNAELEMMKLQQARLVDEEVKQREAEEEREAREGMELVRTLRGRIDELWGTLECSEEERLAFMAACVQRTRYTPQLLDVYKREASRLRDQLPLMEAVTRREFIKNRLVEFRKEIGDSKRLLQRKPDNMRDETKQRGELERELARLNEVLARDLQLYERKHQRVFKYHGQHYLELMVHDLRQGGSGNAAASPFTSPARGRNAANGGAGAGNAGTASHSHR